MARAPALGWRLYPPHPGMEARLPSHLPGPQEDGSTAHPTPLLEGGSSQGPRPTGPPVLPHIIPVPSRSTGEVPQPSALCCAGCRHPITPKASAKLPGAVPGLWGLPQPCSRITDHCQMISPRVFLQPALQTPTLKINFLLKSSKFH